MRAPTRENYWVYGFAAIAAVLVVAVIVMLAAPGSQRIVRSGVEPHTQLADYSWEDLSKISDEITQCATEDDAIWCASGYWLCQEDGRIDPTQTKQIQLADGTNVNVVLVGVWHDTRADGGKAGLTFAFADAVGEHAMTRTLVKSKNAISDTVSWTASDMRSWLNGTDRKSVV